MRRKKNNNLVLLRIGNKKFYFTSASRAGMKTGIASASVLWAINHHNVLISNNDEQVTFEVVDGSDIPYKYINND